MRKIFLVLFILFHITSYSQDLLTSRKTSYHTYIYKLTNKEAEYLYKNDLWKVEDSYFHSIVDSIPTDSSFNIDLIPGHYLKVYTKGSKLNLDILTIQNFDVKILNNNSDLNIQVYDSIGTIVNNANVKIKGKKLKFDQKTLSYRHKKSNKKGLIKVTYNDQIAYYNINRELNNSKFKRIGQKVIYSTPIRFVWRPVRFIVRLPLDGVISLIKWYPYKTIGTTKYYFDKAFKKIACIFDDYYCNDYNYSSSYKGYMVFNKPKYQPGDTVKFKAYILDKNEVPYDKDVNVILNRYWDDQVKIASIKPYNKGGYTHKFYLHDSLDLKLDKTYRIFLKDIKSRSTLISESFEYEDYELTKSKLQLRTNKKVHYNGNELKLFVKGTDENNLNLLDATFKVYIERLKATQYFSENEFIPDTLLYIEKELKATDETEVIIPDSIFPRANFSYKVNVKLKTSDNETLEETKTIKYYHNSEKIDFELQVDSILFSYEINGNKESTDAIMSGIDGFGNKFNTKKVSLPYKNKINPYFAYYEIMVDSIYKTINIDKKSSGINCLSERTKDTVYILIENNRKIPFNYYIYELNKELKRGHSDKKFEFKEKVNTDKNYYISIQYLWGGKVIDVDYEIPYLDKKLNIQINQPTLIYPGQKSKIEIKVTNNSGFPIQNVDLTAFALTSKFNFTPPSLPVQIEKRKIREKINKFSIQNWNLRNPYRNINYNNWKTLAEIDSIEYYKFLYPRSSIYTYSYFTTDSITQFSPFVVHNGNIRPIGVIYIDRKPVYFNWSTNHQPYSFKTDGGYHKIELRLPYKSIIIDSMYFHKNKKTIFSLNDTVNLKNVRIKKMPRLLTDYEKSTLYKYIFPFKNTFGEDYAYLKQNNNITVLNYNDNTKIYFQHHYGNNFAGPISPHHVNLKHLNGYSNNFIFEPFYEYELSATLLKMRCISEKFRYPKQIKHLAIHELKDEVITEKKLEEDWENYVNQKRYKTAQYHNPNSTTDGKGQLLVEYEYSKKENLFPLNILLVNPKDPLFIRVYPGYLKHFHDLKDGDYRIIIFYPGAGYSLIDSLKVKTNGLNYYNVQNIKINDKDKFSSDVSEVIIKNIFTTDYNNYDNSYNELNKINKIYHAEYNEDIPLNLICGFVKGAEDGLSIPGVSVVVKENPTIGTTTDIEGYYCLTVPDNAQTLEFSFVGMKKIEVPIDGQNYIDLSMEADVLEMEQVVVTAFGISRKRESLNYSTSKVSGTRAAKALAGKVAGLQIQVHDNSSNKILLRGMKSIDASNTPLFVIDGVPYLGDPADLDTDLISSMNVIKDDSMTALYGSLAANGVILITTKNKSFITNTKGANFDHKFLVSASQANSIRNNFSDYAYWQPSLVTDEEGKVSFNVTFPDDVTNWSTFVLAINEKNQTGQIQRNIKSYKPLMAQLTLPRFLVEGDSTYAIGKSLNYTMDSIPITINFEINDSLIFSKKKMCINSIIDSLEIIPNNIDTIKAKYFLEKTDGYFDGEEREIPVFKKGLEQTLDNFYVLDSDTTIDLQFNDTLGSINLYARLDEIEIIEEEIKRLFRYKYLCNEQLASKLKAHLAYETILEFKKNKKKDSKQIKKLVKKLEKNQNADGLWGWWNTSESSYWISNHALEALAKAKKHDYQVSINESKIIDDVIWKLESSISSDTKIRLLYIMKQLEANIDYGRYISKLEKDTILTTFEKFKLVELKQLSNIKYDINKIIERKQETIFGNIYFETDKEESHICDNDIQLSLIAYRIIKRDTTFNDKYLTKIRNYFFEKRKSSYWSNTFESAQIIETILPDLLKAKNKPGEQKIEITGALNKTIKEFPYSTTLNTNDKITINKTGEYPIYLTTYQNFWDPKPKKKSNDFVIHTKFENNRLNLKAGESEKLIVDVTVKKDAEYIMIEVPVPAGCSYNSKRSWYRNEVHREYFKNQVSIFCKNLDKGTYQFEIDLLPKYSGKYTLNPAKIELMYFPTFNANNELKKVYIK
ncbi:MAG: carboxypeptidase-like regulatory domain-containing protein [Bacteroidales bacterium]|nr:carboxypeptidase-like regulatory domain-containing protein [Bacteroidales bacterium]